MPAGRRHLGGVGPFPLHGEHPRARRRQDAAGSRARHGAGLVPTTLSYSSSVSLSPAVLLKLLVLEEEREMFDLPFSFSLINGLGGEATQNAELAIVPRNAVSFGP